MGRAWRCMHLTGAWGMPEHPSRAPRWCALAPSRVRGVLPAEVFSNLDVLVAIHDSSVQYVTQSAQLALLPQGLAAAAVKNFVLLEKQCFGCALSRALNLTLPLSFVPGTGQVESVVTTADESRLARYPGEHRPG